MRNYHNSIPTFGKYHQLLNERVTPEISKINELHFNSFSRSCLISSGFMSVIRFVFDETLYIKLYYYDEMLPESKRDIELFASSFYLHGDYSLKYNKCNIIRIPLKVRLDSESIFNSQNISELESLLQLQLTENSWVGVDFAGVEGGLTLGCKYDEYKYSFAKRKILNEYNVKSLTSKVGNYSNFFSEVGDSVFSDIINDRDGVKISISANKFIFSWKGGEFENQVYNSMKFSWKGVNFKLTSVEYFGKRSNTISVIVEYFNKKYQFGYGRSSVGAGSFGEFPIISVGGARLHFQFGKNCISVSEVKSRQNEEFERAIQKGSFQIII